MTDFDVAIIGAGMAGAGLAAQLAPHRHVILLEAEAMPGYHATGRSAAFWEESYGGPGVQPLTAESRAFLENPPPEFSNHGFLRHRGVVHLERGSAGPLSEQFISIFGDNIALERWNQAQLQRHIPGLKADWGAGIWVLGCYDIDVSALHAAYLRAAKKSGAKLLLNAVLHSAKWQDGHWHLQSSGGGLTARTVVNAAGAWADTVAVIAGVKPLSIQPYRRTIVQLAVKPEVPIDLPLVIALDGSFYFKPEAGGRLWLSPHDETPCQPSDAAPDEMDIAIAIDRLKQVVSWDVRKVEHSWAGLRSFAPDRLPVIGRDPNIPEFFWLAGQGGFGIQTAPAISQLAASMLIREILPPEHIDAALYAPERFISQSLEAF